MNAKCELLNSYANECVEYASDNEESDLAISTRGAITSFQKSISIRQTEVVDEKLVKLQKTARDFERALNKDDMKMIAFRLIGDLEKMFARMNETVETGWTGLQAKYHHFKDFSLDRKHEKRATSHAKCETMTV